jgi:putative two-component system response regulator
MKGGREAEQKEDRILIVDDNPDNTLLVHQLLRFAGYQNIMVENDSTKAVALVLVWQPDLIILDIHMPRVSGFEILQLLGDMWPDDVFVPILANTADWTEETRQRSLDLGASDFITKPFDTTELLLRVRNFLRMRRLQVQLDEQNRALGALVERRTRHVTRARQEALECLARAGEFRDDVTGEHASRVGKMSGLLAKQLGMSEHQAALIEAAAPLHDLGKIGISDSILLKPGKLTDEEYELMKEHASMGGTIIGRVKSPMLRKAREIALYHHENWDGSGYPHGTSGCEIPISARIVAVADTFDALTHERPYKRAWSVSEAIDEVIRLSGVRFDPSVVDALIAVCNGDSTSSAPLQKVAAAR